MKLDWNICHISDSNASSLQCESKCEISDLPTDRIYLYIQLNNKKQIQMWIYSVQKKTKNKKQIQIRKDLVQK